MVNSLFIFVFSNGANVFLKLHYIKYISTLRISVYQILSFVVVVISKENRPGCLFFFRIATKLSKEFLAVFHKFKEGRRG